MLSRPQRLFAVFFLFAFSIGAMLSRLADIQVRLGIGEAVLGLSLLAMSAGTFVALTFASNPIARLGHRRVFIAANLLLLLFFAAVAWLAQPILLAASLFCAGLMIGSLEIAINVEADRLEGELDRRIMNRCHGFWSFGFFFAALLGGAMRHFSIAPLWHILSVIPVVAIALLIVVLPYRVAARRKGEEHQQTGLFARPTPYILGLCAISFGALLAEGAGIDWSVIYMRDSFDITAFAESTSLIMVTFVMAMTRTFADPVVDKYGPDRIARTFSLINMMGIILIVVAPNLYVALLGFALVGVGASVLYPLAVSAAARQTDRPSTVNVAALAQTSFIVFFIGPTILGIVAEFFGIRLAFLTPLPLLILAFFFLRPCWSNKRALRRRGIRLN